MFLKCCTSGESFSIMHLSKIFRIKSSDELKSKNLPGHRIISYASFVRVYVVDLVVKELQDWLKRVDQIKKLLSYEF